MKIMRLMKNVLKFPFICILCFKQKGSKWGRFKKKKKKAFFQHALQILIKSRTKQKAPS